MGNRTTHADLTELFIPKTEGKRYIREFVIWIQNLNTDKSERYDYQRQGKNDGINLLHQFALKIVYSSCSQTLFRMDCFMFFTISKI